MYAYFPEIYPDESLYSVLARLKLHLGGPSSMQFQRWLYGQRRFRADFELMGGVNVLAANTFGASEELLSRLIDKHTYLPYYLRHHEPAAAESFHQSYKSGNVKDIHIKLGINTFTVGRVKRLRFCMSCLENMHNRYGEYYWRRAHNLPGSLVCPEHCLPLQLSSLDITAVGDYDFVPADSKTCLSNSFSKLYLPREVLFLAHQLSLKSAEFLDTPSHHQSYVQWRQAYFAQIQALGLARSVNRIDVNKLDGAVNGVFSDLYPFLEESLSDRRGGIFPFLRMLRKPRSAFHPINHALMQVFLENAQNCNSSDSSRTINLHKVDLRAIDLSNIRPRRGKAEDWEYIDSLLVNAFDEVSQQLISERPPLRVTCGEIERRLGIKDWFGKRSDRLPKTTDLLNGVVETIADYQARRVRWHIEEFTRLNRPLSIAALLKAAGLPFTHRWRVQLQVDQFLNRM
ncbi:TnsD family Tn7-like transposition protein [Pseudomonas sp. EL_65y_Pfl1_R32]|uniref:TnsD family Tn7-like transposition protein n=1 Tax=Pseudomonas sp. EL_65y_Pfl1_R32 TaxID=3088696 RepID=UPI0030DCE250